MAWSPTLCAFSQSFRERPGGSPALLPGACTPLGFTPATSRGATVPFQPDTPWGLSLAPRTTEDQLALMGRSSSLPPRAETRRSGFP